MYASAEQADTLPLFYLYPFIYTVVCALFSLVEEAIQQIVFRTQWIIIRVEEGHSSPVVKTYNDPTRCPDQLS